MSNHNRSNSYCYKSGAQKRKDEKIKLQQSLQGVSKLSSYFSPIPQSVPNPVDDEDGGQVGGCTSQSISADAVQTAQAILDPDADLEESTTTAATTVTTPPPPPTPTTTPPPSSIIESVQVFNMGDFSNDLATRPAKLSTKMQD